MLSISEMFYTLQGEGKYSGFPCVFIRTSGCNLRCVWCDTPFASWEPDGLPKSIDDILEETKQAGWSNVHHYIISGGEPMIQKELPELVNALNERGHFITIETAGTVYKPLDIGLFSISPKLANSIPGKEEFPKEHRLHMKNNKHDKLGEFINNVDYQLKFVTCNDQDTVEILEIVNRFNVPRHKVFLMPEGITQEALAARALEVANICKREGFVFTGRLHVDLWGNTRAT